MIGKQIEDQNEDQHFFPLKGETTRVGIIFLCFLFHFSFGMSNQRMQLILLHSNEGRDGFDDAMYWIFMRVCFAYSALSCTNLNSYGIHKMGRKCILIQLKASTQYHKKVRQRLTKLTALANSILSGLPPTTKPWSSFIAAKASSSFL